MSSLHIRELSLKAMNKSLFATIDLEAERQAVLQMFREDKEMSDLSITGVHSVIMSYPSADRAMHLFSIDFQNIVRAWLSTYEV